VIIANPEPAEIRNQIYDLMLEPKEATLSPLQQNSPEGVHGPEDKRLFFAATQVCRQLRSELLPIYLAQNVVHVDHDNLLAYLDVFGRPITNDASSMTGNIVLDMHYTPDDNESVCLFDLLSVLMLCAKSPCLTIQLGKNHCGCCEPYQFPASEEMVINGLLHIHGNDKLVAYVREAVTVIEMMYSLEIVFKIKSEHWQAWMQKWNKLSWYSPSEVLNVEFRAWLVGLGLPTVEPAGLITFAEDEVCAVSDNRGELEHE
jgi:hypothetical protein